MVLSRKPIFLARMYRSESIFSADASSFSMSMMFWNFMQEEDVHRGDLVDLVNGHVMPRRRASQMWNRRWSSVRATPFFLLGVRLLLDARRDHAVQLDLTAANGLHQRALKGVVDGHNLAGGLHLGAEGVVRVNELVKRPARELDNAVVEGRLEAGLGLAGDGVRDLIQTIADRDLCRYLCNRVAGCLGSQCGGTGNAGLPRLRRTRRIPD